MRRTRISVLSLLAVIAVAVGCGKKASETAAEKIAESALRSNGQDADVSIESNRMEIKTEDGSMTFGEGTKLPEDWPGDVPIYKGLKIFTSMKVAQGFSIQGTTKDSLEDVSAFYKQQAAKNGWSEQSVMTQSELVMLNYTKDSRNLAVMVTGVQGADTSVSISVSGE